MAITKAIREKVLRRDNNQCWHCHEIEAISIQHRQNRGMGGRGKSLDRLDNLIVLCSSMNLLVESDAVVSQQAKEFGWKLSSWDDFASPVFNANTKTWHRLHADGTLEIVDPPLYLI